MFGILCNTRSYFRGEGGVSIESDVKVIFFCDNVIGVLP